MSDQPEIRGWIDDKPLIKCKVPFERKDEFKTNIPMSKWKDDEKIWEVPLTYFPELHAMENVNATKEVAKEYNSRHNKARYTRTEPIEGVDAELYPHQQDAVGEMLNKPRYLLAMDMGTGKTLSTIATFKELQNQDRLKNNEQLLVVCPSTLKQSWATEIKKFTELDYTIIDGTPEQRRDQWREDTPIKIVNFALLKNDPEPLDFEWGMVALDEASYIKNASAERTRKAKLLTAPFRYALSGTPLENDLTDLYNIFTFLDPYFFTNKYFFEQRYLKKQEMQMGSRKFEKTVGQKNVEELKAKIQPLMFRVTKQEIAEDLPPITEKKIQVKLKQNQRKEYNRLKEEFKQAVKEERDDIGAYIQYMHMLCDSTVLLNEAESTERLNQNLPEESPKLDALEEILQKVRDTDQSKAIVFTKWKTMAEKISEELDGEVDHIMLHGEHSKKERQEGLEEFEESATALVCTNIFSHGANLQFADYVIHFDQDWNPAVSDQKTDRVHRIGQENPVVKLDIVTENSIEENVLEKKSKKRDLFEKMIDSPSDLDKKDLLDLV